MYYIDETNHHIAKARYMKKGSGANILLRKNVRHITALAADLYRKRDSIIVLVMYARFPFISCAFKLICC